MKCLERVYKWKGHISMHTVLLHVYLASHTGFVIISSSSSSSTSSSSSSSKNPYRPHGRKRSQIG